MLSCFQKKSELRPSLIDILNNPLFKNNKKTHNTQENGEIPATKRDLKMSQKNDKKFEKEE